MNVMATRCVRNKNYRIDFDRMTLIMTADFADKAYDPATPEYETLVRLKTDFPDLKVERKTHSTPAFYKTTKSNEKFYHNPYKGITIKNMERFIAAVDDKEGTYKKEYDRVYAFAQEMGKKRAYAIVAGWFVEQFPKYRTEPFYYYRNRPTLIPFKPKSEEDSQQEPTRTGTDG